MAFVPVIFLNDRTEVRRRYLPFYAMPPNSQINIAQLVVNVTFAALTGVVVANMSKRQLLWTAGILAIAAAATLMVVGGQAAIVRALSDQDLARRLLQERDYAGAKLYFRNARVNWCIAGNVSKALRINAEEKNCPEPVSDKSLPADQLVRLQGTASVSNSGTLECTVHNTSSWHVRTILIHVDVVDVSELGSQTPNQPKQRLVLSRDFRFGNQTYLDPDATGAFHESVGVQRAPYQKFYWHVVSAEGQP
jgi:hypothetical protein